MPATVGVLGFDTLATQKLRREAQTQSELQLRPFVIFEPTEGKDLCVRNIGNNTALNVRVGPFALSPPVYDDRAVMAAFPRPVPFLRKGEAEQFAATANGKIFSFEEAVANSGS